MGKVDGEGDKGKGRKEKKIDTKGAIVKRGRGKEGKEKTYVYSIADMNADASPPVMGIEAVRREVTGRRFPGSGMSLNWRV